MGYLSILKLKQRYPPSPMSEKTTNSRPNLNQPRQPFYSTGRYKSSLYPPTRNNFPSQQFNIPIFGEEHTLMHLLSIAIGSFD